MKKIISILVCILLISALSGCTKTDDNAYELMTQSALEGDFAAAVEYYNKGGADSGNSDVLDWYLYSIAMNDYTVNGCLGYSYDLLVNKCSSSFEKAKSKAAEIKALTTDFDGAYNCSMFYLYISEGKIAVNKGSHLTGTVYCTDELALKDGTYYWVNHSVDGEDTLLYTLTLTDSGITVTAVDEENNMYSGEYVPDNCEMPMLIY